MTRVAIHVVLGFVGGRSDEATRECDLSEVGDLLAQVDRAAPHWRVITVVHGEDLPLLLDGATSSEVTPMSAADSAPGSSTGTGGIDG
jgi:hypothetical protein